MASATTDEAVLWRTMKMNATKHRHPFGQELRDTWREPNALPSRAGLQLATHGPRHRRRSMGKSGLAMLMLCSAMAAQAQSSIDAPNALPATEVTATRFMANWESSMTGMVDAYALDVATD